MLRRVKRALDSTPGIGRVYRGVRDGRARRRFWRPSAEHSARVAFYRRLVGPRDLVFDVGANIGNRSKVFVELGARTVAFEPLPGPADYLELVLGPQPRFTLVRAAVGERGGEAEMLVADVPVYSTLSQGWRDAATGSGRHDDSTWTERITVPVVTLDDAIADHGVPDFVKVDVEGYELEVVSGLSRPVPCLSLEFSGEWLEPTYRCLDRLEALAPVETQLSVGESMAFALPDWVPVAAMKRILAETAQATELSWGDVYVRTLA
jgi:FkbM family methyltransferase